MTFLRSRAFQWLMASAGLLIVAGVGGAIGQFRDEAGVILATPFFLLLLLNGLIILGYSGFSEGIHGYCRGLPSSQFRFDKKLKKY